MAVAAANREAGSCCRPGLSSPMAAGVELPPWPLLCQPLHGEGKKRSRRCKLALAGLRRGMRTEEEAHEAHHHEGRG